LSLAIRIEGRVRPRLRPLSAECRPKSGCISRGGTANEVPSSEHALGGGAGETPRHCRCRAGVRRQAESELGRKTIWPTSGVAFRRAPLNRDERRRWGGESTSPPDFQLLLGRTSARGGDQFQWRLKKKNGGMTKTTSSSIETPHSQSVGSGQEASGVGQRDNIIPSSRPLGCNRQIELQELGWALAKMVYRFIRVGMLTIVARAPHQGTPRSTWSVPATTSSKLNSFGVHLKFSPFPHHN
jgi:hypothetical protein